MTEMTLLRLAEFICSREEYDASATRLARGYRDLHAETTELRASTDETFEMWWAMQVGHPPADERERFAFELAQKAWRAPVLCPSCFCFFDPATTPELPGFKAGE